MKQQLSDTGQRTTKDCDDREGGREEGRKKINFINVPAYCLEAVPRVQQEVVKTQPY